MIRLTQKDDSIIFTVKIVPCASKTEIVGEFEDALKIRLAAPPVDGAANAELLRLLSKTFGVSKSDVEILSGEASRVKQIKISNVGVEKIKTILQAKNRRDILPFSSNPKK